MTSEPRVYALRPPPLGQALGCDALDGSTARGVIESLSGADPLAIWREENPLSSDPPISPEPGAPTLATWSGWIPGDADPSTASIHTWTGEGLRALNALCDRLEPVLSERGRTLLLRPHAAHVLSDPRSCLTFYNDRSPACFGLLLDPIAMLTPPMLPDAADHLERTFATLLTRPETRGVILADATTTQDHVAHAPLGRGLLPPELISMMIERAIQAGLPLILLGDPEPQLGMLGGAQPAKVRPDQRTS